MMVIVNNELQRMWKEPVVSYFRQYPDIYLEVVWKNLVRDSESSGIKVKTM